MPTYSYRCSECDNAFDIQQTFTDSSLTVCPVCGGKLRKVFGVVGITFNGPGFYRTDSRSTDSKHGTKHHAKLDASKPESTKSDSAKSDSAKSGSPKSDSAKTPATASASSSSSSSTASKSGTITK
jgi:putative FmdB family regulatory protein